MGFTVALPMSALEGRCHRIDQETAVHINLADGIPSHEHGRISPGVSVLTDLSPG